MRKTSGYSAKIQTSKHILIGLLGAFVLFSCSHVKSQIISEFKIDEAPLEIISETPFAEEITVPAPVLVFYESETPFVEEIAVPEPVSVLVPYEGDLLNIFFHCVVSRPETAFNSRQYKQFFLDWYVTADEYKKIIDELYQAGYALIHIDDFYEVNIVDGKKRVTAKQILVPEGKKPLMLSIDDLSYYDFVRENASVSKLIIDEKGGIAAWTDTADGGEISYDLDIVTITEDFIKQHPDFSVNGARGIIALTGYEGVLGWKTHTAFEDPDGEPTDRINDPDFKKEVEDAITVVNRLKEIGWRFASHGWGHRNMPDISFSRFMNDLERQVREVYPVLGDLDLYIYPFGAGVEAQENRHKKLRDMGFVLFFGVGDGFGYIERGEYIYIDRRSIDGVYFRSFKNRRDRLFDIDKVIDKRYR